MRLELNIPDDMELVAFGLDRRIGNRTSWRCYLRPVGTLDLQGHVAFDPQEAVDITVHAVRTRAAIIIPPREAVREKFDMSLTIEDLDL